MNRPLSVCILACCGIVLAASQPPQTQPQQTQIPKITDMAGSRANVSNETIEGLLRDLACPIQNLDNHATSMGAKCVQDCVRGGSPLVILTKDDRLYFPISAKMPDKDQRQVLMPFVGKYVRASGIVFERTGTHAIVITEIKEMKDVTVKNEE
ncbi:MAG TPA: hypothetical protein VL983_05805 [Terriglobales bacterium]|nr:hypothetical protein [Terriglobales bacterium]